MNGIAVLTMISVEILVLLGVRELRQNPIHPLCIVIVASFVYYGMSAVELALYPGSSDVPTAHLAQACFLVALSILLYLVGYSSQVGRQIARAVPLLCFLPKSKRSAPLWIRASLLYIVGWFGRVFLLSEGVFHVQRELPQYLVQYKSLFDDVRMFADFSFLAVITLVLKGRAPKLLLLIMLAGEVTYGLLYGGATLIFFPFVLLLLVYSIYRMSLRWIHVAAGIMLAVFVFGPLGYTYREAYYAYVLTGNPSVENVGLAAADTMQNTSKDFALQRGRVWSRFSQLDGLLLTLDRVPHLLPFQYGNTFIPQLLVAPIPRALWPQKPTLSTGRRFAIEFFDVNDSKSEVGTNASIGMIAEFYYNFGYFGMAGFLLIGVLIRFFWERMKAYIYLELCAPVRIPFVLVSLTSLGAPLSLYFGGIIRGSVSLFLYMVILYTRLPTALRDDQNVTSLPRRGGRQPFAS
jgi:hypothetical protein